MDQSELERQGLTPGFTVWFVDQLNQAEPLHLIEHLFFAFAGHVLKKRRFLGTYLELGTHLKASNAIFSVGALLAHTSGKDPIDLLRLVIGPGGDPIKAYNSNREKAQAMIDRHASQYGTEPESLSSLHFATHMQSMDLDYRTDANEIRTVLSEKYYLKRSYEFLISSALLAFGRGVAIPVEHGELFARMQEGPDPITPDSLNQNAAFYTRLLDVPNSMSEHTSVVSPHSCDALELCRIWARYCRPDLLHLIAE